MQPTNQFNSLQILSNITDQLNTAPPNQLNSQINQFLPQIREILANLNVQELDSGQARQLRDLFFDLQNKGVSQELVNRMREISYAVLNPSKETTINDMPTDIKKMFLRNPDAVKAARAVSKSFRKASKEKMVDWLNSGRSLNSLQLSPQELQAFIANYGNRVKHFEVASMDKAAVLELLKNCPNLTSLLIENCKIEEADCNQITSLTQLIDLTQLIELDLGYNNIGAQGASAIAQSLTQLTELNLAGNNIGDQGGSAIRQLKNCKLYY